MYKGYANLLTRLAAKHNISSTNMTLVYCFNFELEKQSYLIYIYTAIEIQYIDRHIVLSFHPISSGCVYFFLPPPPLIIFVVYNFLSCRYILFLSLLLYVWLGIFRLKWLRICTHAHSICHICDSFYFCVTILPIDHQHTIFHSMH